MSSSPLGERTHAHSGVGVVGGHHRLAQPRVEVVSLARHAGRLRAGQQRACVLLGRRAHVAGRQQALDPPRVGLDVARQAVAVGVDPRPDQLAQPRDLDAHGGHAAAVAVQVRAQRLGAHAARVCDQQCEDVGEPRPQLLAPAVDLEHGAGPAEQRELEQWPWRALRPAVDGLHDEGVEGRPHRLGDGVGA